jgi:glycerol kinase
LFSAGQADGIDIWENRHDSIQKSEKTHHVASLDKFLPRLSEEDRDLRFSRWKDAVGRSEGWVKSQDQIKATTKANRIYASVPAAIFVFSSFILWRVAACFANKAK